MRPATLLVLCTLVFAAGDANTPKATFEQCVVSKPIQSFGTCIGIGALSTLQSLDNDASFDVADGVSYTRDEQQQREFTNFLERDPSDFRTIVDTVGTVMAQRIFRWDMSAIYPGLGMRVSPSVDGVLEFTMDPHREDIELKNYRGIGTGKILARQFVVPFLLGLKFKVATIVPIIFGILALLAKKAILVSKIALIISSVIALSSMFFGDTRPSYFPGHGYGYGYNHHHGGYKVDPQGDLGDFVYRGYNGQDQIAFHQAPDSPYERNERNLKGRNFAWNDAEKEIKAL